MSKIGNQVERFLAAASRLREFKDPEEIADFLSDMDYRGAKGISCDCPITRFVKDCIGDPDATVHTNGYSVSYRWPNDNGQIDVMELATTDAEQAFVMAFDAGEYGDLIDSQSFVPDPPPVVVKAEEPEPDLVSA